MSISHQPVPFKDAAAYVLTFGKYAGQKLDDVAKTDAGLAYLDWMRGALRLDFHTRNAVCSYLDDPTIAKDLREIIDSKRCHR